MKSWWSEQPERTAKNEMQLACDLTPNAKEYESQSVIGFGERYLQAFERPEDQPLPRVTLSRAMMVGEEALGDTFCVSED